MSSSNYAGKAGGTEPIVNTYILLLGDFTLSSTTFRAVGQWEIVHEKDTIKAGIGHYLQARGHNHFIVDYCNEMMMIDKDNQGVTSVGAHLNEVSRKLAKFYDIVVISAGMNHLRRGSTEKPEQIINAMKKAVEEAIEAAGKRVILVGLPDTNTDMMSDLNRVEFEGLNPADIARINEGYRMIAAQHIGKVTCITSSLPNPSGDGLHWNKDAKANVARQIGAAFD